MNIAQQLLHGSVEIDRMWSEIDRVVKMLRGKLVLEARESEKSFQDGECVWGVTARQMFGRPGCSHHIWLFLPNNQYPTRRVLVYTTNPKEEGRASAEYAHQAYNSLPHFVEWMFEEFKYLPQKCKPFLDAAGE